MIAMRADYYGRCAAYPELSDLLARQPRPGRADAPDELRRAIELPGTRVGLRVEPELADALVADVEEEPGALPLLSTALLELWQRRARAAPALRRLRAHRAACAGRWRGSPRTRSSALDDAQQAVARGVLHAPRRAREHEGAVERRRVPLAEIENAQSENVAGVLALLTDRACSRSAPDPCRGRARGPAARMAAAARLDRRGSRGPAAPARVTAAAEEWGRLHEDEDALYAGTHLTEALEWRASRHPALNPLEREFLDASDARRKRARAARRRRIEFAFAALAVALAAISVVAVVAIHQGREARPPARHRRLARHRRQRDQRAQRRSLAQPVAGHAGARRN